MPLTRMGLGCSSSSSTSVTRSASPTGTTSCTMAGASCTARPRRWPAARRSSSGPTPEHQAVSNTGQLTVALLEAQEIQITSKAGVPTIGYNVNEPVGYSDPTVTCLTPGLAGLIYGLGPVAKRAGVKKLAMVNWTGLPSTDDIDKWFGE